ncbi:sugar O-acetyltransferase [Agrilactobacillus fermenti]|uniref:sugar O-acetyltransferase n=1 Tax=Agrilactobacillus fermenti TaxID=2586909 RepID=UPI003A5C39CC
MAKSEKAKMLANEQYLNTDSEIALDRRHTRLLINEFNQVVKTDAAAGQKILKQLFAKTGAKIDIQPDFHCDYGYTVEIGENFFANYNCVLIDVGKITIGDNCLFGPGVHIYSVNHPLNPELRNANYEFPKPVTIGNNVWIGGSAVIVPGVTLGDNVTVAAGAVVTKSFGNNVVIGGNPARVLKAI